jgi:hypothetical protein
VARAWQIEDLPLAMEFVGRSRRHEGRHNDARALFEQLLELRNDVGLLVEEYDPRARRQVGNYPQAFSHVALINTAHNLTRAYGPAQHRAESKETIGHNTDTAERLT